MSAAGHMSHSSRNTRSAPRMPRRKSCTSATRGLAGKLVKSGPEDEVYVTTRRSTSHAPTARVRSPGSLRAGVILFASYSGALGGAERLLIEWAYGLEGEIGLACPAGALAEAAQAAGLRVVPLRSRSLALRRRAQDRFLSGARIAAHGRELRHLAEALEPELLILWGMRSALAWLLLARRSSPCTVFQHNDFLPSPLIGRAVRAAAARADLVLTLSHAAASDLDPTGVLSDHLEVVHPGVDAARFEADAVPAAPPKVLLLGALVGWKRPDLALDALALVRPKIPALRLRLVGAPLEDDIIERLRARADATDLEGAVEFPGAVPDPAGDL